MTKLKLAGCTLMLLLLAGCDIRDDLQIRADGSGTYRALITAGSIFRPLIERIRTAARHDGYRVVDDATTLTTTRLGIQKEFTDIHELNGSQAWFDFKIKETPSLRHYHFRAQLNAVANGSFNREFTITMPAAITSSSDGRIEGQRVVWFCSNGGTIDVDAQEKIVAASQSISASVAFFYLSIAIAGAIIVVGLRLRRPRTAKPQKVEASANANTNAAQCRTCHKPLAGRARYCPWCGDVAAS